MPDENEHKPEVADRKIKVSEEFMSQFATRDENGNLLIWNWGEPDEEGFYTPTVTVDTSDHTETPGGVGDVHG